MGRRKGPAAPGPGPHPCPSPIYALSPQIDQSHAFKSQPDANYSQVYSIGPSTSPSPEFHIQLRLSVSTGVVHRPALGSLSKTRLHLSPAPLLPQSSIHPAAQFRKPGLSDEPSLSPPSVQSSGKSPPWSLQTCPPRQPPCQSLCLPPMAPGGFCVKCK